MDFRQNYLINRNNAITFIKDNAEIINQSLTAKPLYGYYEVIECCADIDCEVADDSVGYRRFLDPITIHSIQCENVIGYSSLQYNIGYGELVLYSLDRLNIETLIQLTERVNLN